MTPQGALTQAARLADLFCPVTPAQTEAHEHLAEAIRAADLHGAVKSVQAMKRRPLATAEWSEWAESWLSKVDRLIVKGAA